MRIAANGLYPPAYSVDLRRPDLFTERDFERWGEIHEWIKNSPAEVIVNSAFDSCDHYITNKLGYGGGGFHYIFWFYNEEYLLMFVEKAFQVFPEGGLETEYDLSSLGYIRHPQWQHCWLKKREQK